MAFAVTNEVASSGGGVDGGPTENVMVQAVYYTPAGNATVPATYTFTGNEVYATCDYCVRYYRGCTSELTSSCAGGSYFGRGGSMGVSQATQNASSGAFASQLTNLRLVEWNFSTDAPVAGGRCYQITSEATTVTW